MLFFYGTGTSRVRTEPLPDLACGHCGTLSTLTSTVFSRYVHFFWIPIFPFGKISVTECQHCKQTLTAAEMPPAYRAPVQAIQAQARPPLTNYAALFLVGAAILFIFAVGRTAPRTSSGKSAAAAPAAAATGTAANDFRDEPVEPGARYRASVNEADHSYCLMEVTKVAPDSVYYRSTAILQGELSAATATLALRDSLAPGGRAEQVMTKFQWHYVTTGQGLFRQFD